MLINAPQHFLRFVFPCILYMNPIISRKPTGWNKVIVSMFHVPLARHVSGVFAHHQEHYTLYCSCTPHPFFCVAVRLSRKVCLVWRALRATPYTRTTQQSPGSPPSSTTKTGCRTPHAAIQGLMLLMMSEIARNMSS
jgi:hypothetical protein